MEESNESKTPFKFKSWMFLVAAFVILAVIGVLTS